MGNAIQVNDWQVIRRKLHQILPSVFAQDPMDEIASGGKLREAYHRMNQLGIIPKVRLANDTTIRNHFERTVGMVKDNDGGQSFIKKVILYGVVPVAFAAVTFAGVKKRA